MVMQNVGETLPFLLPGLHDLRCQSPQHVGAALELQVRR